MPSDQQQRRLDGQKLDIRVMAQTAGGSWPIADAADCYILCTYSVIVTSVYYTPRLSFASVHQCDFLLTAMRPGYKVIWSVVGTCGR